ncbi:MAG TPA: hypothetical protein VM406_11905, partial [Noviherbaspirillum sp.]|nr:hypothetical protein [Noviherbaspirillum sp.]
TEVPALGPLGPIAGGLLGGHLGGLIGGLASMRESGDVGPEDEDPENAMPMRHAGMYVAVVVPPDHGDGERMAADALIALGATDLELSEGNIVNGDWVDFDPSIPPHPYQRVPRESRPSAPTQRA